MFHRSYLIPVDGVDDRGATALHFAAISLLIKNVQALIKLGADPNCQDIEGNTPMHLCLETLFDDNCNFDKVKNIVKELIFSGAVREIKNEASQTPMEILGELEE